MGDCTDKTKPIAGASRTITLTETPLNIAALLAAATPPGAISPSPAATRIIISFNIAPDGVGDPIARISRDGSFTLTSTTGERILQASKIALTVEQFGSIMRSKTGSITAMAEQFEVEV